MKKNEISGKKTTSTYDRQQPNDHNTANVLFQDGFKQKQEKETGEAKPNDVKEEIAKKLREELNRESVILWSSSCFVQANATESHKKLVVHSTQETCSCDTSDNGQPNNRKKIMVLLMFSIASWTFLLYEEGHWKHHHARKMGNPDTCCDPQEIWDMG